MRLYLGIIGIFSFLYYFFAVAYTRRWKSTFILFWPAVGIVHLMILLLWDVFPLWIQRIVQYGFLLLGIIFLVVEFRIYWTARYWRKKGLAADAEYLIVLGAQVRGTYITNSLIRRLDAAVKYLDRYPDTKAVVSGGQGKGEDITEAEAMARYLASRNIETDRIIKEDRSTSTSQNFRFSAEKIGNKNRKTAVVTNDFHLYRALRIAKKEGYSSLRGIAADSNPVLYLNYMVREFFALIWMQLRFLRE